MKDEGYKPELSPTERVIRAIERFEKVAHDMNEVLHDPREEIFVKTVLRDGRDVDAYFDYEQPIDHNPQPRLQLIIAGQLEPEVYMFDADDPPGRQTTYTAPDTSAKFADVTSQMADRMREILDQAQSRGDVFFIVQGAEA